MRLYNGCPDDELAMIMDTEDNAEKEIKRMGYIITYFPLEGGYYLAYANTYRPIGDLFDSKWQALQWLLSEQVR